MLAGFSVPDLIAGDARRVPPLIVAAVIRAAGPGTLHRVTRMLREPFWLDEDSWGTGPDAEEGQAAMESMMAGNVPASVPRHK